MKFLDFLDFWRWRSQGEDFEAVAWTQSVKDLDHCRMHLLERLGGMWTLRFGGPLEWASPPLLDVKLGW